MLDFGTAVRQFYGQYANAEGRSQRSAYWWVQLYQVIIYTVLAILVFMSEGGAEFYSAIGDAINGDQATFDSDLGPSGIIAIVLGVIFALVNFLPNIMLSIRRFHDLGRTGWLFLVFLIVGALPVIGTIADIANLIWFMFRGTVGSNQYGPDPLGHDPEIFG